MSDVKFTHEGFDEYLYWQSQDKKTLKKINALIKDILRNGPLEGEGSPEALKHNYSGSYSRRIDGKNRLVYTYHDDTVTVLKCKGHYKD